MITRLTEIVSEEMLPASKGALNCLPYARVLVRSLHLLGESAAKEIVARAVVFGAREGMDYEDLFRKIPARALINEALRCDNANGKIVASVSDPDSGQEDQIVVPFRTLGYPHGHGELGDFHDDGTWTGHIVVCYGNTMIDSTLGQINHADFGIHIEPLGILIDTSPKRPFADGFDAVFIGGQFVYYEAFPDELSYMASQSWGESEFRDELERISERVAERIRNEAQAEPSAHPTAISSQIKTIPPSAADGI